VQPEATGSSWQALEDVFARFHRVLHSHFVNSTLGLTASQVFILRYLASCPQATKASDIAKAAGLSPGAVTQVCDELVRMGYVERSRSTADRRVVHVRITQPGREKLDEIRKLRIRQAQSILEQLGQDDVDEFVRIVNRILEIVEKDALSQR
jgi:DNA-binding MarR family transcriptional regulator